MIFIKAQMRNKGVAQLFL